MASRVALGLAAAAASVAAVSIPRDAGSPGIVSFPLRHVERFTPVLSKRAADTDVSILNISSTSYLVQLSLGTPGQKVEVALDTGSSELWVNPDCSTSGSSTQQTLCQQAGSYDPQKSSSSQVFQNTSSIKYGKGEVQLQYVADNITFPGSTISLADVTFGYGTESQDLSMGIMGVSFGNGYNLEYNNVIDEMVAQKVINAPAFGVALGAKNQPSNSGIISFGGVDTKKYSGALHTSPILPPQNGEDLFRFWIQLDSVGHNGKAYANSQFPVFFDTGSTLSYLPQSVMSNLISDLSGTLDSGGSGLYIVPCGQKGSLSFTFGNFTVNVDLSEFIWDLGSNQCVLGASAADDGDYLLGDSFLRSVYAVFDMTANSQAIYFAQYVDCGSNEQAIPAGAHAAASFQGECTAAKSAAPGLSSPVTSAVAAVVALTALMTMI